MQENDVQNHCPFSKRPSLGFWLDDPGVDRPPPFQALRGVLNIAASGEVNSNDGERNNRLLVVRYPYACGLLAWLLL